MLKLLGFTGIAAIIVQLIFLNKKTTKIMSKTTDAIAKLDAIGTTLDKVSGETSGLVTEVAELKEQAGNEGVSDELMAKIDSIAGKAQSIDDLVTDTAPTTGGGTGDGSGSTGGGDTGSGDTGTGEGDGGTGTDDGSGGDVEG